MQQEWIVTDAGQIGEYGSLPAGSKPGDVVIFEQNGKKLRGTVVASDASGVPALEHVLGVNGLPDPEGYLKRLTEEMKKYPGRRSGTRFDTLTTCSSGT